MHSDLTLCTASDTELWHTQNSVYLGIFRYIQRISALLSQIRPSWGILRHIQVYSGIFSTMSNPRIFTTLPYSEPWYLEPKTYSKPCETLTRHIQTTAIVRPVYSSIIQPYPGIFRTLCNVCICRNLAYLESWNIHNPSIIASRRILRSLSELGK